MVFSAAYGVLEALRGGAVWRWPSLGLRKSGRVHALAIGDF